MRRGQVIEFGDNLNPFFQSLTRARAYHLRQQDGSIRPVSTIALLREVKDGSIKQLEDLPLAAWQISNHFMMLARELVWENVRVAEFQSEPSRQRCLFLFESEEEAYRWIQTLGFPPMTHWVVKLSAMGRVHKVDSNLLAGDGEPLTVWYDKARRYWRGEMTSDPHPEVLFTGTMRVEEILDPARFSGGKANEHTG